MSAYMVSKKHIDAIVSVILSGPIDKEASVYRWRDRMKWAKILGSTDSEVNALGDMLIRENLSSIHARYPDTITNPDNTPGPNESYWLQPYTFEKPESQPTIAEAAKLLACYEYQSCEHPEWEASDAFKLCQKLKIELLECIPGYDSAPWGLD